MKDIARKKNGRIKRWECYEFNEKLEKNIYAYLCQYRVKKKELRRMDECVKFDAYMEWEQYIKNKYEDYPIEKLKEFSRYLNQKMRNVKPGREYWTLAVPVMLTLITDKLCELIIEINNLEYESIGMLLIGIFCTLVILFISIGIILEVIIPILDANKDENFYLDYKEVIDLMIGEKDSGFGLK